MFDMVRDDGIVVSNGEDIFNGYEEGFVEIMFRGRNLGVNSGYEFVNFLLVNFRVLVVEGVESRIYDDRGVIIFEVVGV